MRAGPRRKEEERPVKAERSGRRGKRCGEGGAAREGVARGEGGALRKSEDRGEGGATQGGRGNW